MKGFGSRNLKYMRRFAEEYRYAEIVQQVAAQLPWFHIVVLLDNIKDNQHICANFIFDFKILF
ncbi:MAG: DUF1016 N-terminal domain-containing protein [Rickettsia endosymbiont of Stiretrus anchorago]|nr:DUF1016 N-terminal domain-containing protein [Rickettsia endosymbiont of Stiretrus anchorago]